MHTFGSQFFSFIFTILGDFGSIWGGPGEAKFAQEASETRRERPTSVQEGPKSCLRSAQESPRAARERPRAGQEAFGRRRNFSKILLGALQILICTRSWPNCLFEKLSGRFLFVFCVMRWMASMLRCAFRTAPASVLLMSHVFRSSAASQRKISKNGTKTAENRGPGCPRSGPNEQNRGRTRQIERKNTVRVATDQSNATS